MWFKGEKRLFKEKKILDMRAQRLNHGDKCEDYIKSKLPHLLPEVAAMNPEKYCTTPPPNDDELIELKGKRVGFFSASGNSVVEYLKQFGKSLKNNGIFSGKTWNIHKAEIIKFIVSRYDHLLKRIFATHWFQFCFQYYPNGPPWLFHQ